MACFAPRDSILVFEPFPRTPFVGVVAVRKDWADFLARIKKVHLNAADLAVSSSGKLGYSHFFEEINMTTASGEQVHTRLRTTQVYEKIERRWLIIQEHKSAALEDQRK